MTSTKVDDRQHALYRFYGHSGELLYIGISVDLPARIKKHRAEKDWWADVARIAVEHFPGRGSVLAAEQRAIIAEQPRWNIQHAPPRPPSGPDMRSDRIRAVCIGCRKTITGSGGVVHVSNWDIGEARREWTEVQRRRERIRGENDGLLILSGADLFAGPDEVPWRVHCDGCNPHESEDQPGTYCHGCYWFAVDRCRTWAALAEWTAHLSEKDWLMHTDWFDFIRGVAAGARVGLVADSTDEDRSA